MPKELTATSRKRFFENRNDVIIFVVVTCISLAFIFPLLWMVMTAIRSYEDIYKEVPTIFPGSVTLENFIYVFNDKEFLSCFINSVVVTVITVSFVIFSSLMGGYAFGMKRFKGQKVLFSLVTLVLAIPYIMYLIPIYIMELYVDLRNTWFGLILPYIALNMPWGLLIMRGAFSTIPMDLKDAATIDGCSEFRFVFQIVTPILKPSVAATTIITFVFSWEEFMFASTINKQNYTLPVYFNYLLIRTQGQEWGRVGAVITVSIIPVLILFIVFRKFFIKGLSEGMLKA